MRFLFSILVLLVNLTSACLDKSEKVKMHVMTLVDPPENKEFVTFWKEFSLKFNSLDTVSIKRISLDSIWLWGDHVSSRNFIRRYYDGYAKTDLSMVILDTNKTSYSWIGCNPSPPVENAVKDYDVQRKKYMDACNCMEATINDTIGSTINASKFTFLETTKGYRIFGITSYSHSWTDAIPLVDTTVAK